MCSESLTAGTPRSTPSDLRCSPIAPTPITSVRTWVVASVNSGRSASSSLTASVWGPDELGLRVSVLVGSGFGLGRYSLVLAGSRIHSASEVQDESRCQNELGPAGLIAHSLRMTACLLRSTPSPSSPFALRSPLHAPCSPLPAPRSLLRSRPHTPSLT
jgi:hypothetical protein